MVLLLTLLPIPLLLRANDPSSLSQSGPSTINSSDKFHFGFLWPLIREEYEMEQLYTLIRERKKEIAEIKEFWRPLIEERTQIDASWRERVSDFQDVLAQGKLLRSKHGSGCAYFLYDRSHQIRYVVKPFDEDMLCLHNAKRRASPFLDTQHRVREAIPLYETIHREMAAATIASILKMPSITPWVMITILRSDSFYDISEALDLESRPLYLQKTGDIDKEKLCIVQPYIPETIEFGEAMHEWFEADQGPTEDLLPLDQESFENANLFVWTIYDCDGHGGNFLLYLHSLNEQNQAIYGLIKIDSGLSFPTQNKYLLNYLAYAPNAKLPLSLSIRHKIASLNSRAILEALSSYGLPATLAATEIRLRVLKELAQRDITIEEMNHRMELLSLPSGEELALMECSREELENSVHRLSSRDKRDRTTVDIR